MSASKEWTEWHLTPTGWVRGSEKVDYQGVAYSGERERPFWLNVNTLFLNASPTEVCTPGVHVQSIS